MNYFFLLFLILSICSSNRNLYLKNTFENKYPEKVHGARNTSPISPFKNYWSFSFPPNATQKQELPKVKLNLSEKQKEDYSWDSYVRYSIEVSDPNDGDSKYGEINNSEVLLEIEFVPSAVAEEINKKTSEKKQDHRGLSLMKKSTCFNCHADKSALTGPSFSDMADRYNKDSSTLTSLTHAILNGSTGKWGEIGMPSNPDFTVEEAEQIIDYILIQGERKKNWVLPGLEGTFQIIKKPDDLEKGVYILKASYTSTSLMKAQDTRILHIE